MSQSLPNLLGETMEKIRSMVDANTILGNPISTPDGVTILPVSRIKIGFAGGGADFAPKAGPGRTAPENNFGGGTGGAVSITPVAFLVIKGESVRLLPIAEPASTAVERVVEMLPDLIDQVSGYLRKKGGEAPEEI